MSLTLKRLNIVDYMIFTEVSFKYFVARRYITEAVQFNIQCLETLTLYYYIYYIYINEFVQILVRVLSF
jgi:hypothetical protein